MAAEDDTLNDRLSAGSGRLSTAPYRECSGPSSLVERPEDLEVIKNRGIEIPRVAKDNSENP